MLKKTQMWSKLRNQAGSTEPSKRVGRRPVRPLKGLQRETVCGVPPPPLMENNGSAASEVFQPFSPFTMHDATHPHF